MALTLRDLWMRSGAEIYDNRPPDWDPLSSQPKDSGLKKEFGNRVGDLYGIKGQALIESRGVINIPREAALLASSPNAIADLIGNQASGMLGGSAKRPSDTIFKNETALAKPISLLNQTPELLKTAVEPGTHYFVKKDPAPGSMVNKLINAATNADAAQTLAIGAVKSLTGRMAKDARNKKNPKPPSHYKYGTKWADDGTGKLLDKDKVYSKYYKDNQTGELKERNYTKALPGQQSSWDLINDSVLKSAAIPETKYGETLKKLKSANQYMNTPYVLFKVYGKETANSDIILPGTILGLSEDFAPVVNSFKFVGSPFNLYRYGGVERSLKFSLKLYFTNQDEKVSMKRNLDKLKKMVFPDEDITAITYTNGGTSQLAFNPNILRLTINGLYDDIFVILDSLSISVDDNIPWVSMGGWEDGSYVKPHPSVFDVALSMKIIEHPAIKEVDCSHQFVYGEDKQSYTNYFTGLDEFGTSHDEVVESQNALKEYESADFYQDEKKGIPT